MRKNSLALLALSLLIILAFTGCTFPGTATGPATSMVVVPSGPGVAPTGTSVSRAPNNTDGAETILIPGGTFWMGSDKTDAQAKADEMPRHQVTLKPFYIYTHEVTSGMYVACVKAGACLPVTALKSGPTSHYGTPAFRDYPVTGVDWLMARDYCTWAKGRLPTEAEWELASRSTESLRFPWGAEEPTCDRVNMLGCKVPPDTLKVGSLANGNSAYDGWDMSGNVWEWVHDWHDKDFYFFSPASNPLGPNISEAKVVRGGGLYSKPPMMRSAARQPANPYRAYDDVGFRCVAMGPLDLSAGYAETDDRHERVPPDTLDGGGETIDDPGGIESFSVGGGVASCPGADGRLRIFVEADSSVEDVEYSVTVEGNPFDCSYDEVLRGLHCEGPVPDDNDELTRYDVAVRFGDHLTHPLHEYIDRPLDCPTAPSPFEVSGSASCPEDGWVTVIFEFEPPIVWDAVRLDGADVMCWPLGDAQMNCIVPPRSWDALYYFQLHGTDAGGREYSSSPVVGFPAECEPVQEVLYVDPICSEDRPMVRIAVPPDIRLLESVSVGGTALACVGVAPDEAICGELPGPPDSMVTVTICLAGEPCFDQTVTVPACPATETEIAFGMIPGCVPTLGPVVTINYSPSDQPLVSANADGSDLTCEAMPDPGLYMCHGITEAPGSELTITFCLADGSCHSGLVNVRDCGGEEPSGAEFRIAGVGCHDETRIFFIVDTGLEWLVPGAGFTYSAWDEDHSYSCSVHPTIPGRLYCSGERPGAPARLRVCVQKDGAPSPICQYFPEWPSREASIPDCAAPPPPPPPGPTCSSHPDPASCTAAGCKWDKGPPDGNYHCYNP